MRADQARRRHHLEALVDADEKFGRHDRALDRAELRALDLPRNRAQLARRIDLGLDAAAGILLQRRRIVFGEYVARIVEGRQADFHRVGLALRRGGDGQKRECQAKCEAASQRSGNNVRVSIPHNFLPAEPLRPSSYRAAGKAIRRQKVVAARAFIPAPPRSPRLRKARRRGQASKSGSWSRPADFWCRRSGRALRNRPADAPCRQGNC